MPFGRCRVGPTSISAAWVYELPREGRTDTALPSTQEAVPFRGTRRWGDHGRRDMIARRRFHLDTSSDLRADEAALDRSRPLRARDLRPELREICGMPGGISCCQTSSTGSSTAVGRRARCPVAGYLFHPSRPFGRSFGADQRPAAYPHHCRSVPVFRELLREGKIRALIPQCRKGVPQTSRNGAGTYSP